MPRPSLVVLGMPPLLLSLVLPAVGEGAEVDGGVVAGAAPPPPLELEPALELALALALVLVPELVLLLLAAALDGAVCTFSKL